MGYIKGCIFYRNCEENHKIAQGIGYCDLGLMWVICDGNMNFCEHPEKLIKSFYEEWVRWRKMKQDFSIFQRFSY